MDEDRPAVLGRRLEDREHPRIVEREVVHGGKEADAAEPVLAERPAEAAGPVRRRRVEHEAAREPRGVPCHRRRDRGLVAGDARHQRGARHAVPVELLHPAIRERGGASGRVPSQPRRQIDGGVGRRGRRGVPGQRLEEIGREEVAVGVVERLGWGRNGGHARRPPTVASRPRFRPARRRPGRRAGSGCSPAADSIRDRRQVPRRHGANSARECCFSLQITAAETPAGARNRRGRGSGLSANGVRRMPREGGRRRPSSQVGKSRTGAGCRPLGRGAHTAVPLTIRDDGMGLYQSRHAAHIERGR